MDFRQRLISYSRTQHGDSGKILMLLQLHSAKVLIGHLKNQNFGLRKSALEIKLISNIGKMY